MKKLLIVLIATVILSFSTNDEKKYSLSWSPAETDLVYGALENSKQTILKSNTPVSEAIQIVAMIDSAKRLIAKQIQPQLPKK